MSAETKVVAAGAVLALIVFAYYREKIEAVLAHPVKEVIDYAGGQVIDIGGMIGIPATNETECQKALREGRTWDASFACDAGTWLGSIFK